MRGFGALASRREQENESGFTLIELTISLSLLAFVFAGLAAVLAGGLRTLTLQKARTQGNEVASLAIEDLQRFDYDHLGLCASPSATPPAGLGLIAYLSSCQTAPPGDPSEGENPCLSTNPASAPPLAAYSCVRINVSYSVVRYVSWIDSGYTGKRLAVFVSWRDTVGIHTVSQQSSVRSPSVASSVGFSPPVLTSPTVSPSTVNIDANGKPTSPTSLLTLHVSASGLSTTLPIPVPDPDKVFVTFFSQDTTVIPNAPITSTTSLTTTDGINWSGTIASTDPYTFGEGSQFFSFSAVRASDGKAAAVITTTTTKFCPSPADHTCTLASLPAFTATTVPSTTVSIDSAGALTVDVAVSATTTNLTSTDTVRVNFPTLSGLVSVFLLVDPNSSCSTLSCRWIGTIPKSAGYEFARGAAPLSFSAVQVATGSTTAIDSSTVTFG